MSALLPLTNFSKLISNKLINVSSVCNTLYNLASKITFHENSKYRSQTSGNDANRQTGTDINPI